MKSFLKLIGFIAVLWLLWQWVKEKRQRDVKYNLPEIRTDSHEKIASHDSLQFNSIHVSIKKIPLIEPDNFKVNESYKAQLVTTYAMLFDSLQINKLSFYQAAQGSLSELDAATVIQLLAYHQLLPERSEQKEASLVFLGLVLRDKMETNYFVKNYLMKKSLWLKYITKLHFLLMEQPQHELLNEAYLTLITPADTEQALEYFKEVQFLERGYSDDYYSVNTRILERFDKKILNTLLDKVDDYSWYAAYPERDAEQGILELLKK